MIYKFAKHRFHNIIKAVTKMYELQQSIKAHIANIAYPFLYEFQNDC